MEAISLGGIGPLQRGVTHASVNDDAAQLAAAARLKATFTASERQTQRGRCGRSCCNSLPVLVDFAFETSRHRLATALVLLQAAMMLILQEYLPRVGLPSTPFCVYGVEYITNEPVSESVQAGLDAFYWVYRAYMAVALLALSQWNSTWWLLVAAPLTIATFFMRSVLDAGYCFHLAQLPVQLIFESDDESPYSGSVSSAMVFYNLLSWVCTLLVTSVVTWQAVQMLSEKLIGRQLACFEWWPACCCGHSRSTTSRADSAATTAEPFLPSAYDGSTAAMQLRTHITTTASAAWNEVCERVADTPLRHIVASLVTSVGIVVLTLNMNGLFTAMGRLVADIRDAVEAATPPDSDPPGRYYLVSLLQLSRSIAGTILGTAADICTYAPFGMWAITLLLIAIIVHSFLIISEHHRDLVKRYAASPEEADLPSTTSVTKKTAVELAVRTLMSVGARRDQYHAPNLRMFSYMSASQYIATHLVTNLVVCLFLAMLVAVATTAATINFGSFFLLFSAILTAFRSFFIRFALQILPYYVFSGLCVLFSFVGVDFAGAFGGWVRYSRSWYVYLWLWVTYVDGPFILSPRVFLLMDLVFSLTLGIFIGVFDAITRLAISSVWGLLRSVILYDPVVPDAFSWLDRPFCAYGGMLRMSHAGLLDTEAGKTADSTGIVGVTAPVSWLYTSLKNEPSGDVSTTSSEHDGGNAAATTSLV